MQINQDIAYETPKVLHSFEGADILAEAETCSFIS